MAEEIGRAGGTVEKFAGDAVMAVFGVPEAHEDHAERALHAALAMQRRLETEFGGALALRVGVDTGEVVSGRAREGSSFVTGDAVNVAARLEQASEPGAIVVGARTAEAVRGAFELGPAFEVDAKGKSEPVVAQTLVRALTLMRPRGLRGGARAFVGRDTELALLQAIYRHAAEQREPHVVTLMGDAGVGKTTLVRELWRWLADQAPQPLQRTGRCLAYGHVTYWALGEILREQLGLLENEGQESVRLRLGDREILGLALGLDVTGEAHPLAVRDLFQEAWVELLSELTAATPTVVLDRGPALGRRSAARPARAGDARRARAAARDRHRPARAARPPAGVGRRSPQRVARLAGRALSGRVRRNARRARPRRALERDTPRPGGAGGR